MSELFQSGGGPHAESPVLRVNMGEGVVASAPHIIVCAGLGSCVALALYERHRRIGGLAHVMLPDSSVFRSRFAHRGSDDTGPSEAGTGMEQFRGSHSALGSRASGILRSVYQCADTAFTALLEGMLAMGAAPERITAKLAGGARMFSSYENGVAERSIGEQNILAVMHMLREKRISLAGSHVGGSLGRNVEFRLDSGRLIIKGFGTEAQEI